MNRREMIAASAAAIAGLSADASATIEPKIVPPPASGLAPGDSVTYKPFPGDNAPMLILARISGLTLVGLGPRNTVAMFPAKKCGDDFVIDCAFESEHRRDSAKGLFRWTDGRSHIIRLSQSTKCKERQPHEPS